MSEEFFQETTETDEVTTTETAPENSVNEFLKTILPFVEHCNPDSLAIVLQHVSTSVPYTAPSGTRYSGIKTPKLDEALARAMALYGPLIATQTGNHGKYADLADAYAACRNGLVAADVAVLQLPTQDDQGVLTVTTRLAHGGEWAESDLVWRPQSPNKSVNDLQALGLTITYLRRFALLSMTGLAPTDFDGDKHLPASQVDVDEWTPVVRWFAEKDIDEEHLLNYIGRTDRTTVTADDLKRLRAYAAQVSAPSK